MSDVDVQGIFSKTYDINAWENIVRIYKGDIKDEDIWRWIWSCIIIIAIDKLHMSKSFDINSSKSTLLSTGINSVLIDNSELNNRKTLPTSIKIVDSIYDVDYFDKPSQVDHTRRKSLMGQIDSGYIRIELLPKTKIEQGHAED